MSEAPYWRILAVKVAAAGPYQLVDRCHFCQGLDALASFQPSAFAARVACCRRCREARTGVPDIRGLIHGTATVSRPLEALTPVPIRGLLPAVCDSSRPRLDVDAIFAPWGSMPGELAEIPGDSSSLEAELLALTDLDAQLDAMIAHLDQRRDEALLGLTGSNNSTSSETPALTIEALADLKAKYGRRQFRIVLGCPLFPPDRAFEWGRRGVMFLGTDVLEALKLDAGLAGRGPQVHPFTLYGTKIEPWGSVDDHQELALELARELDPS